MNQDRYLKEFSSPQCEALDWLERETNLRTNHSRMLSGQVMGNFLSFISQMVKPKRILEIGTFTGYSTIALSSGLSEGGVIDALELNDELEDLILEGFERAGIADKVKLHIGDAKETLPTLNETYDLIFIDANKREYLEYYNLVIDKLKSGGFVIADNVLWDGKVFDLENNRDAQTVGIQRFNEFIKKDERVENVILSIRDGINLIRKK